MLALSYQFFRFSLISVMPATRDEEGNNADRV